MTTTTAQRCSNSRSPMGRLYAWVKKFKQDGESALEYRRGKAKEDTGQLTEIERLKLENKRLQARLAHVSTEAAVLKKL